jgi:hypothetical protein
LLDYGVVKGVWLRDVERRSRSRRGGVANESFMAGQLAQLTFPHNFSD